MKQMEVYRAQLYSAQSTFKKNPGSAGQKSLATARTNFTKPGAQNKSDPCISPPIFPRRLAHCNRRTGMTASPPPPPPFARRTTRYCRSHDRQKIISHFLISFAVYRCQENRTFFSKGPYPDRWIELSPCSHHIRPTPSHLSRRGWSVEESEWKFPSDCTSHTAL